VCCGGLPWVANLSGGFVLKITVLLVEDSKFQRLVNERMLLKAGYTVLNASDG
jgi:PleD family two-component response regulator